MNFYYDPILGLQFTAWTDMLEINLTYIPPISVEKYLNLFKKYGVCIMNREPITDPTKRNREITQNHIA